jgi:hypothetical protein
MKKKILAAILALPCLLIAENGFALDVGFVPRAAVGYTFYSFEYTEQQLSDPKTTLADLEVNLMTGTLGGTLTMDMLYFDAYVQQSTTGSDDYLIDGTDPYDWDVDVLDYAFTLGFNVWRTMAVYGGWKGHETTLEGSAVGEKWDAEFDTNGWFTGLSYGIPIGASNMLSFNVAYAWLEGDIEDHQIFDGSGNLPAGTTRDFRANNGDADGLTIGASWKGYFTDALSYTLSADWYDYSYEDFDHEYSYNGAEYTQTNWTDTVDEQAFSFRFILSYDL